MTKITKATSQPHGSPSRYINSGCRCDLCRAAWIVYTRPYRKTYKAKRKERKGVHAFKNDICIFCGESVETGRDTVCLKRKSY